MVAPFPRASDSPPVFGSAAPVVITNGITVVALDPNDMEAVVKKRWNVLLCGEPPAVAEILSRLRPHFREPVRCWRADGPEAPPDFSGGTLIVEHLNKCQPLAQQALLDWCSETKRDVQVVTAINTPLFDLVERGCFLEPLYYRLNTVYVDLMN